MAAALVLRHEVRLHLPAGAAIRDGADRALPADDNGARVSHLHRLLLLRGNCRSVSLRAHPVWRTNTGVVERGGCGAGVSDISVYSGLSRRCGGGLYAAHADERTGPLWRRATHDRIRVIAARTGGGLGGAARPAAVDAGGRGRAQRAGSIEQFLRSNGAGDVLPLALLGDLAGHTRQMGMDTGDVHCGAGLRAHGLLAHAVVSADHSGEHAARVEAGEHVVTGGAPGGDRSVRGGDVAIWQPAPGPGLDRVPGGIPSLLHAERGWQPAVELPRDGRTAPVGAGVGPSADLLHRGRTLPVVAAERLLAFEPVGGGPR